MDNNWLNEEEMQLWYTWKCTFKNILDRVVHDMSETGLSEEGDFGILVRLVDLGNGELRQQELVDSMEWTKSRLSHHLTRMEQRGLVLRKPLDTGNGVQVIITPTGKTAVDASRPIYAKSVRKHFLDQLTEQDIELITKLAERIDKKS